MDSGGAFCVQICAAIGGGGFAFGNAGAEGGRAGFCDGGLREEIRRTACQSDGVPLAAGEFERRACAMGYSDDCLMGLELERVFNGKLFMRESDGLIDTH